MKPRLTLGTRIFAMTAILVILAVGTAVIVTYLSGDRIAGDAARQTLTRAGSVQAALQDQRLRELTLNARLFAADSAVVGYFGEALDRGDTLSILDQLEQRQDDLGFDFAMVLDEEGRLVARTDDPEAAPRDLSHRALVAEALREYEAAGFWKAGDRLYQAVAVPLAVDRILIGYLVTGFALDDLTALQVSRISEADVAYLVEGDEGLVITASALESPTLARELTAALAGSSRESFRKVMDQGRPVEQMELELAGRPWLTLLRPLTDAAGQPVGVAVSLASLQPLLAPFRHLETVLLVVGLVAILLAGGASYLLSRRVMKPVRELTRVAEAAREGDYDQRIEIDRSDEVGRLGRSFDHLLSELREKQDMEAYVADLSRTLGEEEVQDSTEAPRIRRLSLVAVELRHYGGRDVTVDPEETVERLARDLRRLGHVVKGHGGEIRGIFGGRVLAVFEGGDRGHRALGAAGEIVRTLGQKESAFDDREPPSVALIDGETVEGTVHWSEGSQTVVLGTPLPRLDVLLREATPGDVALASS
ncbi:MAG: cache domain-containing protein, partial [Thermoanaerobaculia bacterium]|nr:cache domain-containing protein [Thermoanaerobaculia bacterium]